MLTGLPYLGLGLVPIEDELYPGGGPVGEHGSSLYQDLVDVVVLLSIVLHPVGLALTRKRRK